MLRFDPTENISFRGTNSTLTIIAEHEFRSGTIVFQVQSNKSGNYSIHPSYGYIQPCDSTEIKIQANFNDSDDHDNDEFTFQYFLVEDHQCDGSAENYWKQHEKTHRKNKVHQFFYCNFEKLSTLTQYPQHVEQDTSANENPMIERSFIADHMNLTELGIVTCKMHEKVVDVKKNLDDLFHDIDAQESRELKRIKESIGDIAIRYRQLEDKATSLVEQTSRTAADVRKAAIRAIQNQMTAATALMSIAIDFQTLENEIEKVRENHNELNKDLNVQADRAKYAKEINDRRAAEAEELRENARNTALLSIPGAALLGAPVALAISWAEDSEDDDSTTVTKVFRGVGGFLLGVGAGIGITAISPFLLAYSATCGVRLAALSRQWSTRFQDIEGNIREVADFIEILADFVRKVQVGIKGLAKEINKGINMVECKDIQWILTDVADKSEALQESCEIYRNSAQANKILMKKIAGQENKA